MRISIGSDWISTEELKTGTGVQGMDFEEDDLNWMDDYQASEIAVSDLDLLTVLDHLDSLDPKIRQQDWYVHLSDPLDKHMRPKLRLNQH